MSARLARYHKCGSWFGKICCCVAGEQAGRWGDPCLSCSAAGSKRVPEMAAIKVPVPVPPLPSCSRRLALLALAGVVGAWRHHRARPRLPQRCGRRLRLYGRRSAAAAAGAATAAATAAGRGVISRLFPSSLHAIPCMHRFVPGLQRPHVSTWRRCVWWLHEGGRGTCQLHALFCMADNRWGAVLAMCRLLGAATSKSRSSRSRRRRPRWGLSHPHMCVPVHARYHSRPHTCASTATAHHSCIAHCSTSFGVFCPRSAGCSHAPRAARPWL